MGMCLNKRVLIGLGVVALGVLAFAPGMFKSVAPLLLFAACPLSMGVMMWAMARGGANSCGTKEQSSERDEQIASRGNAAEPAVGVSGAAQDSSRIRDLEEEVRLLRAESRLREQQPSV